MIVPILLFAALASSQEEWRGRCDWDDDALVAALSAFGCPRDEATSDLALEALRRHRDAHG